ncbi:MAG: hypothetical protein KY454_02090 [Actinobacteria bacterium]|nr:hypothetical protein [Actinomycetota bacterium]MBW3649480.1 hypothetical protein [Actinomycetota bacterium]
MTDSQGQGSAVPPPSNVSALVEAIDARARQAGSEGAATLLRGTLGSVSEVLAAIQDRLDHLEDVLAERPDSATAMNEQVQAGLANFNARLARLEEAFVRAVEDSGSSTEAVVGQLRQTVLAALQEAPARESSGHDQASVSADLAALGERLERLEERLAEQAVLTRQLFEGAGASRSDDLATLQESIDSLGRALTPAPAAVPTGPSPTDLAEQVKEAVRREAELLTQRVAALAVGVEASRALLEQHVEETENSLGRKATEVTRRLASDLGLRARRGGQPGGGRRDPRQIGPGA